MVLPLETGTQVAHMCRYALPGGVVASHSRRCSLCLCWRDRQADEFVSGGFDGSMHGGVRGSIAGLDPGAFPTRVIHRSGVRRVTSEVAHVCRYGCVGCQRIHFMRMPDYLTPGHRNSGEGPPAWKRPLFIILAVLTVLVVVAAYFFSSDRTSGLVAPVIAVEISRRKSARRYVPIWAGSHDPE